MSRDSDTNYNVLMEKRIRRILMICSSYDAYVLEEDGQIDAQVYKEYVDLNISNPPSFTWVTTSLEALELLKREHFDLIICMFNIGDLDVFRFSRQLKDEGTDTPIVLLTNFSKELYKRIESEDRSAIDYIFSWHSNVDLIIAIIKLIEDKMNAEVDIFGVGVQCILLVEDSIRYYSTYLPAIYKLVLKQSAEFMQETLNEQQQKLRKRARPKIFLATNYEDAIGLYQKYKDNMLGVISDVGFVLHKYDKSETEKADAGIDLCKAIRQDDPLMPVILQSSQLSMKHFADEMQVGFVLKYSQTLLLELSEYISREFAFGDFVVRDLDSGEIIAKASNLREMQILVSEIPDRELLYLTSHNRLSKWMFSRGLIILARKVKAITNSDFKDFDEHRTYLVNLIKDYRITSGQGVIAKFDSSTYNRYIWFARIGEGSIGGKARGLAFLNSLVQKYSLARKYQGVELTIPRTMVLATDIFDDFIVNNGLQYVISSDKATDDEILSEFVSSQLPESVLAELKVFIETVNTPLAVRSSSKLEDSNFQPFAGIYSTYMIPLTENRDQMLRLLAKAVKSVYASVYFARSRTYIHTTANLLTEEKMGIVIQSICGSEDQGFYFPTLSGVARSVNFYPIGYEKPEEGIVNMAYGLGKLVVEGGKSLRFSPKHPDHILQTSTMRLALVETQEDMYALDLSPEEFKTSIDDGVNIHKFSIDEASRFRNIKHVASTYDYQNDRISPGTFEKGRRLITFDNILKYDTLPLAQILSDLLEICKSELRCNVEMEFAMDMDVAEGEDAKFNLLQVRPVTDNESLGTFEWDSVNKEDVLISADHALGRGYIDGVTDIVYVRNEHFDNSKTEQIAEEILALNRKMQAEGRSYILVGPGRWGSSDPWLGIPIKWNYISEAKVIVECGLKNFEIEPSQGTHFFQNLTSLGVGYLTINPFRGDGSCDFDRLDAMKAEYESEFLRVIRFAKEPTVFIDGRNSKGIVLI